MNGGLAKTGLLISPARGSTQEPPVSNLEVLRGFCEVGTWLRTVPAYQALRLAQTSAAPVSRAVASSTFFQSMGQLLEDVVCNLVAWAATQRTDQATLIADSLQRVFLKADDKSTAGPEYLDDRLRALSEVPKKGKGSVSIDPSVLLSTLDTMTGDELLELVGIARPRYPSVKLVPRSLRAEWDQLPDSAKTVVQILTDATKRLVTLSYNKLKHGPQIAVASPVEVLTRRGHEASAAASSRLITPTGTSDRLVRVLGAGARVQETADEEARGTRVAPMLVDSPLALEEMFFGYCALSSHVMHRLSWWLVRGRFGIECERVEATIERDPLMKEIYAKAKEHRES